MEFIFTYEQLKENLTFQYYTDEEYHFLENEILDIVGIGRNLNESIHDMWSSIIYLTDYYKKLNYSDIHPKARHFKKIYNNLWQ